MMATAAKEDGTSNSSNSNSLKVALSFGYNGAEFEGLDRYFSSLSLSSLPFSLSLSSFLSLSLSSLLILLSQHL
jgi:hypothetical protein